MEFLLIGALVAFLISQHEPLPPPPKPEPRVVHDETVVVMPGPDGRTGSVVVEQQGNRLVLDKPFAASSVRGSGTATGRQMTRDEAQSVFGAALAALPARPATFLLYFLTGKDELTPASQGDLRKVLAELKSRPIPDVVVTGHTDTVGAGPANDKLSLQRAERVKGFLVEIGIPAERIEIAGRGERELLVPTADNVAEEKNRRVEINVR
jgi:outer membrane protein OmpA-like peptidoglycan-associated protein